MKSLFTTKRHHGITFAIILLLSLTLSLPAMGETKTVKSTKTDAAMQISVTGATLVSEQGHSDHPSLIYEVEQGSTAIITCSRKAGSKEYSIDISTTTYDPSGRHFGKNDELKKNASAQYKIAVPVGKTKKYPNGVGSYITTIDYGTPNDHSMGAELTFRVVKKIAQTKQTPSGSYKGTMARLGSKMQYSFSGGTATNKSVKYSGTDESDMNVFVSGDVAPGSTVTAACKKLAGRKDHNDVKVEISATTADGRTQQLQNKKGKDAATASANVPTNAKEVSMKMTYTGRMGKFNCFVNWNVVKKASESSKSFKWDDVGALDRCPSCNGQFSNYYVNNFVGVVGIMCNSDPQKKSRKLDSGHGKLEPIYYNDYIYTGSEDWLLLDHNDEEGVLKILGNSKVLLQKRLANGSDHWIVYKGSIVGKSMKHAGTAEPSFQMSSCTATPTGTTYVLEDDGKTSRVLLLEGSMEVVSNNGSKKQTLKSGQVATVASNGQIKVDDLDVGATAKKYGITGISAPKSTKTTTNAKQTDANKNNGKVNQSTTNTAASKGKYARYDVKCGIVKRIETKGNERTYYTTWWDDYGRLERTENTKRETKSGNKWTNAANYKFVTIIKDDKRYHIDPDHKRASTYSNNETNYLDPNLKLNKGYGVARSGATSTISGKQCDVFKGMTHKLSGDASTEYHVWKGIPLKSVVKAQDGTITTTLESIETPSSVDASLFTIPNGYTVK